MSTTPISPPTPSARSTPGVVDLFDDTYGPPSDQWITSNGIGLIVYAVAAERHRVLILRLL